MMIAKVLLYFGVFYATWICFLAIMNLRYEKKYGAGLNKTVTVLAIPLLIVGVVLDALTNLLASTILLEPPQWQKKEFLLSPRLERLVEAGPGDSRLQRWRFTVSLWAADTLLAAFDRTGGHTFKQGGD